MHLDRLARVLPLAALLVLVAPSPVAADHCGAVATVSPVSGPVGTTFVFETNLGEPSVLRLYRAGHQVREVALGGSGDVRYEIVTHRGDAGAWRARAVVRTSPACAAEAAFTVLDAPDTATAGQPETTADGRSLLLVAAAVAGFGLGRRRRATASR